MISPTKVSGSLMPLTLMLLIKTLSISSSTDCCPTSRTVCGVAVAEKSSWLAARLSKPSSDPFTFTGTVLTG